MSDQAQANIDTATRATQQRSKPREGQMQRKVSWGVLGCAGIGQKQVIPAFTSTKHANLVALASRDHEKALAWGRDFSVPYVFGSYQDLLSDPQIEAVYIPLPNSFHCEWVLRAAQAGKHILCEKPFALTSDEARKMVEVCQEHKVLVHEAFMYRFHPRILQALDLLDQGRIGRVLHIKGSFSYQIDGGANIRLRPELGGGALMDVGCYCVNFSRMVAKSEPVRVCASMTFVDDVRRPNQHQVDVATTAMMEFSDGLMASFSARFDTKYDGQWLEIIGTNGSLYIDLPFNPPIGDLSIRVNDADIKCENANHFALELDAFSRAIRDTTKAVHPKVSDVDCVSQAKVVEALYQAAREKQWVLVS